MTKIKLTKAEAAPYKCSATYEWECNEISRDDSHFLGDANFWYCEPLFEGHRFRTLKGVKHAIQLYVDGELNSVNLEWCEEE